MGILDSIKENRVSTKLGRKQISYDLRKKVWDYWQNNATTSTPTSRTATTSTLTSRPATTSTLTSRPAKLRVSDRNKTQSGLEFVPSVTIVMQRRRECSESCWMTVELPYKNLHHNFVQSHDYVSYGTFITHNDIDMCCCKEHLHARWPVAALIECSEKNSITLEFNNYLTKDC